MIDEIIEIIELYLDNLDREYDNDMVVLAEKILNDLDNTRSDIFALFSAVPMDVPEDVKDKVKNILNF